MKRQMSTGVGVFAASAILFLGVGGAIAATTALGPFKAGSSHTESCVGTSRLSNTNVKTQSETVNCSVPTTTTVPSTTTTTKVPPTTTTTAFPSNCTSSGSATLGPFYNANIYFSDGNGDTTYVKNQNVGANTGSIETLCDPTSSAAAWTVAATMQPASAGNVQYFPNTQEIETTAVVNPTGQGQLLSGFSAISSTFNSTSPPAANGNWELAYDLWFDNRVGDVMIWENISTARGTGGAHVINSNLTIAGQSYTLMENCGSTCAPQSDEIMLVHNTNTAKGTENILADIEYLQGAGYVPSATGISEVNFGWEICGTAGTTENFALNDYSLTQTPVG